MKQFSLVAAFVLSSPVLFAQNAFGVKAGLNLSSITNYPDAMKVGFHVGGLAHLHVTHAFSVQPEVMFSSQGGKQKEASGVHLNYINVPVLLQYNFDNGFRLQAGPQVGFRLSAKKITNDVKSDIKDLTETIDFSIPLGASYLSNSGVGVDARYNIGITNVFNHLGDTYHNAVIQVGVFYLLNHKHKQVSK